MKTEERYRFVIEYFKSHHPNAETELKYNTPFELLVAVILSAQCTDKRVNMVTPGLFSRFPDAESLSAASVEEVFSYIRSISYPNNKAKHLVGMANLLISDFNGLVPEKVAELEKLPGVGRKTANVIASVVFNQPAMAVDTHVFRVSARLGLTRMARNPKQAEEQLVKNFPKELIAVAHHWLILHGRYICKARKPECAGCGLKHMCNFYLRAQKKSLKIAAFKQNKT
jgi:endonuclease-3